jgi:hypothetical protein
VFRHEAHLHGLIPVRRGRTSRWLATLRRGFNRPFAPAGYAARGGTPIARPRDRRAESSSGNGYAAIPSSSLPPLPTNSAPRLRSGPEPVTRARQKRSFPWTTIAVICAIILLFAGIYIGTHDYWPQLLGGH